MMAAVKRRWLFRGRGLRILAGAVLAAMLSAEVFAVAEIFHAAGHDCEGKDCPVCALVLQCEQALQSLGSGRVPEAPRIAAIFGPDRSPPIHAGRLLSVRETQVSLKVRLNL